MLSHAFKCTTINVLNLCIYCNVRGHPFMTATWRGAQAQVDACGWGRGGQAPCGRPHRKLKIESTYVILSSSHAKKLVSFLPEFRLWTESKVEIFRRYKLVIKIINGTVLNKLQVIVLAVSRE